MLFFPLAALEMYSLGYAQEVQYADFAGAKIGHLPGCKRPRCVHSRLASAKNPGAQAR
ncbi:MAG: hypothetical protein GY802_26860 [Gammaproteobacteria bacterium]|nr:hypothetical protein [Gammaproteobacteria bacterium]